MLKIVETAKGKNLLVLSSTGTLSILCQAACPALFSKTSIHCIQSRSRGICRQLVEASILSYFQDAEAAIEGMLL